MATAKHSNATRKMISKLTAFERGQLDFIGGRRECPFKDALKSEQWRDGWFTECTQGVAA